MEKEMKIAVLIDAENIAPKYIGVILSEANGLGNVIFKRIYGNWTSPQMNSWKDVILDNSLQPIQQYNNASGKNSSDSSLIIDAMDLLYSGRLNAFCIVSSDSDFTRLAARLRESEMHVLGMGEQKTPRSFISACNKFAYLDILYNNSKGGKPGKKQEKPPEKKGNGAEVKAALPKQAPAAAAAPMKVLPKEEEKEKEKEEPNGLALAEIKSSLIQFAEEKADDDGWIHAAKLADLLGKKFPDFDARNFGQKTFLPFVKSLSLFEVKRKQTVVYLKLRQTPAQQADNGEA
jgi:hypothetical protein